MTATTPTILGDDRVTIEHVERITSEHARMADLLRHVHATHYGNWADMVRAAQEFGLDPTQDSGWVADLLRLLGAEIDELLTEVYSAPVAA